MKISKAKLHSIIREELEREARVGLLKEGFMDRIKAAFGKGKKKGGKAGGPKAAAEEMAKSVQKAFEKWEMKKVDKGAQKQLLQMQKAFDQLEDKFMEDGVYSEVSDIMGRTEEFFKDFVQWERGRSGKRGEGEKLNRTSNRQAAADLKDKRSKDAAMDARMRDRTVEKDRTRSKFS